MNVKLKFYIHAIDYTTFAASRTLGNHTGWVTVVTPADRPKVVRNRCVIEPSCSVFV